MSKGLFITGTGTDIGKTYITALILKKLKASQKKAAYYKAAMSGNERDCNGQLIPGDAKFVKQISGIEQSLQSMCPFVYEHAVSPHLAARMEGNPVNIYKVKAGYEAVCKEYDYITMEGSGGIVCPICFEEEKSEIWLEDIIRMLEIPSIIVADAGIGTINDVVLTVEYMKQKQISVKGIIFNRFEPGDIIKEDNIQMVKYRTGIKVIACVKEGDKELKIDEKLLVSLYE